MEKGREKLRCDHFINRYNLRLTRYRRLRVEIPEIDLRRRHTRFVQGNDNEGQLVAVHHYEPVVPLQQRQQQQPQRQQQQQRRRRRTRNRRRAPTEQQQRVQVLRQEAEGQQVLQQEAEGQRQYVQEAEAQRQNVREGGSVWSEREDKILFQAVAHYKRLHNSSSMQWISVFGYYILLGGVAVDIDQLKVHLRKIVGLRKAGHLNDCAFFNDPNCGKDFDMVFQDASSSFRSSSSMAIIRNPSQSYVRSLFVPVEGGLSLENR